VSRRLNRIRHRGSADGAGESGDAGSVLARIVGRHSPESQCFFVWSPKHEGASRITCGRNKLCGGFALRRPRLAAAPPIWAAPDVLFSVFFSLR